MRIQNFHIDKTVSHKVSDPHSGVETIVYNETKSSYTYTAMKEVSGFKLWVSTSPDPDCLNLIQKYCKDYYILNIIITNKTTMCPGVFEKYKKQKKEFIVKNLFDECYEYKFITYGSDNHHPDEYTVVKLNDDGGKPWYTNALL